MDKIDTYLIFKSEVVEKDMEDFLSNKTDLRKAFHCAISLFHLADWVYIAKKSELRAKFLLPCKYNEKDFYNALGKSHHEFQVIREIANATKHFEINNPKRIHNAADMFSTSGDFSDDFSGDFDIGRIWVKGIGRDADEDFSLLAQATMRMWNDLFREMNW